MNGNREWKKHLTVEEKGLYNIVMLGCLRKYAGFRQWTRNPSSKRESLTRGI
jgi:hypothetical protein